MAVRRLAIKSKSVLNQHFLDLADPEGQAVLAVFRVEDLKVRAAARVGTNVKLIVRRIRKIVKIFIRQLACPARADPEVDFPVARVAEVLAVPAAVSLLMNVWPIAMSIWMNAKVLVLRAEECRAVVVFQVAQAEDFLATQEMMTKTMMDSPNVALPSERLPNMSVASMVGALHREGKQPILMNAMPNNMTVWRFFMKAYV